VSDQSYIVQFIHPGGEQRPDDGLVRQWNRGPHKRKFLKQKGKYVDGKLEQGDIVFWGEWEPESRLVENIVDPLLHGPRFLYEPYYFVPQSYRGLENTDPFVFGETFYYIWCLQKGKPSLRNLPRGSVILFGSCEDKNAFVLDTVFVVDRWIDHNRTNYKTVLAGAVPREYEEVTIFSGYEAICGEEKSCSSAATQGWRLYFGATCDNLINGMHSFFPCQIYEPRSKGFARPRIALPQITGGLNRGIKLSRLASLDEMKTLWDIVVGQVRSHRLALGVYAEMPERRLKDGHSFGGSQGNREAAAQTGTCL